jgi:hypothetical protein
MRLESGGWTRQVTVRELGISKVIAGVNMRLNTGGVNCIGTRLQIPAHRGQSFRRIADSNPVIADSF